MRARLVRATGVGIAVLMVGWPHAASAQDAGKAREASPVRTTLTWLGGGLAGLGIHESGHVVTSALFGAEPSVRAIRSGPVPFFAITHQPVSAPKEYVISASGLWTQGASVEWLLHERPHLARERAPFLKGIFAFHVATSTMYGFAGFARAGPRERDTRGMAAATGIPEPAIGGLVLAPAVLDVYRYYRPESAWARWASRGAKALLIGLALTADGP